MESGRGPWCPGNAIDSLKYFSKNLRNGAQEDAQEFLNGLLDRLREEFDKIESFKGPKNPVRTYFAPKYDVRYYCSRCKTSNISSPQYQEELTIFLDIHDNLQTMVNKYLMSTIPSYDCKKCKTSGEAKMKAAFSQLPKTFIFCAKRFKHTVANNYKINSEVQFTDSLELPYEDENNQHLTVRYELTAVVLHLGNSLNSGHYECVSRLGNQWFHISDSSVRQLPRLNTGTYKANSYIYLFSRTSKIKTISHKNNCVMTQRPFYQQQHNQCQKNLKRKGSNQSNPNFGPNKFQKFDNKSVRRTNSNGFVQNGHVKHQKNNHNRQHQFNIKNNNFKKFHKNNHFQKSGINTSRSHSQGNRSNTNTALMCPNS